MLLKRSLETMVYFEMIVINLEEHNTITNIVVPLLKFRPIVQFYNEEASSTGNGIDFESQCLTNDF